MMKKILAVKNEFLTALMAILAIGVLTWGYQLKDGLAVTGMNKPAFWGIYIVTFVFFIGVSAGGIAVAALSHLAGIQRFKPIARVAEVVAIISLALAMLGIIFDLGRPDRMLHLFLYPQFTSPLTWDVMVINTYFALCAGMLYFSLKHKAKAVKILAIVSIPVFVLVHSVTAWIFGLMKSQPGWHTSILAPLFIVSALVSGLGLIILTLILSRKYLHAHIEEKVIMSLGAFYKGLLPLLFYFLFSEFITTAYPAIPHHSAIFRELISGKFAGIFWFDIVLGIVIPFLIIISIHGKTIAGVGVAAFLAFLGVFAERLNIVVPTFYHPFLTTDRIVNAYTPTWVEYTLVAALLALGATLFILALRFIPVFEEGGHHK